MTILIWLTIGFIPSFLTVLREYDWRLKNINSDAWFAIALLTMLGVIGLLVCLTILILNRGDYD